MCLDCGCSKINRNNVVQADHHEIKINHGILSKNNRLAQQNRSLFRQKGLFVINLLSSPGSGKTALIERIQIEKTIQGHSNWLNLGVIVGDLATDNDARRLQNRVIPAVQITTGNACHLEANMVANAAKQLNLDSLNLLIIENVGNLVCPAAYDLGEDLRIVLLSATEGEDKPLKYPTMFKSAQVVIITKIDLAKAIEFDQDQATANIKQIAPQAEILETSAKTGIGINSLLTYLFSQYKTKNFNLCNSKSYKNHERPG